MVKCIGNGLIPHLILIKALKSIIVYIIIIIMIKIFNIINMEFKISMCLKFGFKSADHISNRSQSSNLCLT